MSLVQIAEFTVPGTPIPQGSKSARVIIVKGGMPRASIYDDNAKVLKPWREAVTAAARVAHWGLPQVQGPVVVELEFRFERPKSVKREYPTVKPDLDKLMRAVLDGVTDSGLWKDDAQVIKALPSKAYAAKPGVHVRIGELREGELLL